MNVLNNLYHNLRSQRVSPTNTNAHRKLYLSTPCIVSHLMRKQLRSLLLMTIRGMFRSALMSSYLYDLSFLVILETWIIGFVVGYHTLSNISHCNSIILRHTTHISCFRDTFVYNIVVIKQP